RPTVLNSTLSFLESGLQPRPITRDIDWGVPIPVPGYEDKRIYVWFEACTGYLSASIEWARNRGEPELWKEWWTWPNQTDDFTWEEFIRRNNEELVATWGNLVHRTLTFAVRNFEGAVPSPVGTEVTQVAEARAKDAFIAVQAQLGGCHFKEAVREFMGLAQY